MAEPVIDTAVAADHHPTRQDWFSILYGRRRCIVRDEIGSQYLLSRTRPAPALRAFPAVIGGLLTTLSVALLGFIAMGVTLKVSAPDTPAPFEVAIIVASTCCFAVVFLFLAIAFGTIVGKRLLGRRSYDITVASRDYLLAPKGRTYELTEGGRIVASFDPVPDSEDWTMHSPDGAIAARSLGRHMLSGDWRGIVRGMATVLAWVLILVTLFGWVALLALLAIGSEAMAIEIPVALVESLIQSFSRFGCFLFVAVFIDRFLGYPALPRRIPDAVSPPGDRKEAEARAFREWLVGRAKVILLLVGFVLLAPRQLFEVLTIPLGGLGLAIFLLRVRSLTRPSVDIVADGRSIGRVRHTLAGTTLDLLGGPAFPPPERLAILAFLATR